MLGSLIGGVTGLIGSALGYKSSKKSREQASYLAQNQIQMRVADAKAAGINPLVAMGITPYSASPSYVQGLDQLSQAGQDLGRAATMFLSRHERRAVANLELQKKAAEARNMELQNTRLEKEINSQPSPMGSAEAREYGIVGQGNLGQNMVRVSPGEVRVEDISPSGEVYQSPVVSLSKQKGVESGIRPFYGDRVDDRGNIWRMPTPETAEILESSFPDWLKYNVRSAVDFLYSLGASVSPPRS